MRQLIIFLLALALVSFSPSGVDKDDMKKEKAYQPGEHLKYLLYYGPINGGIADMKLKRARYKGDIIFHAKMVARTTGIADRLFKVKDIYESYFFPETGLPKKAIRDISEGSYTYYNEVWFDHEENIVTSMKSGKHEVPEGIFDMVSLLYQFREFDFDKLKPGDAFDFQTFFGDEIFPFKIRYRGTEVIKTKLGRFDCHKFVPIVEPGRIFEDEDDMTMWLSNDKNQVPIRIRFDMIVGSFNCDLIEYKNLKYDLVEHF
jgi:hypothetical protein